MSLSNMNFLGIPRMIGDFQRGPQRIFHGTPVATVQTSPAFRRATFPTEFAEGSLLRRDESLSAELPSLRYVGLIYSGSYCGRVAENGPTRESRPNARKSDSSSDAPARGDRSINFTSLPNPIFSRYPRVLHDTFY